MSAGLCTGAPVSIFKINHLCTNYNVHPVGEVAALSRLTPTVFSTAIAPNIAFSHLQQIPWRAAATIRRPGTSCRVNAVAILPRVERGTCASSPCDLHRLTDSTDRL